MQPSWSFPKKTQNWFVIEACNTIQQLIVILYVGCYYYTIGNISPMYRSSLKAIFILYLVENPILVDYGHDKILEPAVKDIKQLENVNIVINQCMLVIFLLYNRE